MKEVMKMTTFIEMEQPSKVEVLLQSQLFGKLLAYVDLGKTIVFNGNKEEVTTIVNNLNIFSDIKIKEVMKVNTRQELLNLSKMGFNYFHNTKDISMKYMNVYEVYLDGEFIKEITKE